MLKLLLWKFVGNLKKSSPVTLQKIACSKSRDSKKGDLSAWFYEKGANLSMTKNHTVKHRLNALSEKKHIKRRNLFLQTHK